MNEPRCPLVVDPHEFKLSEYLPGLCRVCGGDPDAQLHTKPPAVAHDNVNHPTHYTMGGIEVIDAIEAWGLGFNTGNAVKYLARAGKKDPAKTIEDLRKAAFYVQREITKRLKAGEK